MTFFITIVYEDKNLNSNEIKDLNEIFTIELDEVLKNTYGVSAESNFNFKEKMNLNQYKELCGACDEILNSSKSSVITKSIVWLHVLNPHPTTQERYTNVWEENKKNNYKKMGKN